MKSKSFFEKRGGRIEKIRIPDEDVVNWINALKEGGDLSDEEIHSILINLNDTYRRINRPKESLVEEILIELKQYMLKTWNVYPQPVLENFLIKRISDLVQNELNKLERPITNITDFEKLKNIVLSQILEEADYNISIILK